MIYLFLFALVGAEQFDPQRVVLGHDLQRAIETVPGIAFKGETDEKICATLNQQLVDWLPVGLSNQFKPCADFDIEELNKVQEVILAASSPEFNEIYVDAKDARSLRFPIKERHQFWKDEMNLIEENPKYLNKTRDGKCHETVMLF